MSSPFGLLSLSVALFLTTSSCDSEVKADSLSGRASSAASPLGTLPDESLAAHRVDLLDLGFRAASALPMMPHVKNRSRAQEAVVEACLELDQPRRALGFVERIDNWRRGSGFADLAFYCAQHGGGDEVQRYLDQAELVSEDLARRIAETTDDESLESAQEWQRDRIRAGIASTYVRLGMLERAAPFEADIVDSEAGRVDAVKAMFDDADEFDARLAALEGIVAAGTFEEVQSALESCVLLFDRFYDDVDRRSRAQEKIELSWSGLPVAVRIDLIEELAASALDHGDRGKALELVEDAKLLVDGSKWSPEDRIAQLAPLAELRHRAGDAEGARSEADAALALYDAQRDAIVDIFRAGALRPLAEAYHALGDTATAVSLYGRAVEESVVNPNSRPRAEDLSAICCSMALRGVEPDARLWARMVEVCDALGDPW